MSQRRIKMAKKKKSSAFAVVQQIGKSFFLPVSVLPIAGILLGLGSSFTNADTIAAYHLQGIMGEGTILNALLTIMSQVGNTIFGNLPLIFALAVALGMAKNEKAVAVLSAGISFFVMNSTINAMLKLSGKILADGTYAKSVLNGQITSVCGIDSLQMGVFAGVIVGLVTAALHNRFYKQQLPAALAFFSGVRFVPIISVIAHIGVGIICFFVWPTIQSGIFALGNLVMHSGYFGTAIFGFLERALIPFGLHHVFYLPFWQTSLGGTMEVAGKMVEGAQNIFFAQLADPNTKHFAVEACRFMTGKYSFMMAGLPGAAYAMYRCAKPEKRKIVGGLLFSAALTSFLTGITEPIEFTFLFIAPGLFILHCGLAGLSFALMHILKICIGTTFSCGLIDFMLYGVLQGQTKSNWMMILPVFAVYAVLYYFVFKFVIEKFDLPTPGRDDDEEEVKLYTKADYQAKKGAANEDTDAPEDPISFMILKGLGGIKNIEDIDCCATRLRITVTDETKVTDQYLKQSGSKGIIKKGTGIQIIYGPQVSVIKSNFEEYVEYYAQHGTDPSKEEEVTPIVSSKEEEKKENLINTFNALLEMGVIPIVNENDAISVEEEAYGNFGDNDTMAAHVARLVEADLLILMSDIEGLYTDDPRKNPNARFVHTVRYIDEKLERMGKGAGSAMGTGGMATKIEAAKVATKSGADMVIANGANICAINDIMAGKKIGTLFMAERENGRKII